MATAKDSLRSKVDRLSEEEAQEILGLIAAKGPDPAAGPAARCELTGLAGESAAALLRFAGSGIPLGPIIMPCRRLVT